MPPFVASMEARDAGAARFFNLEASLTSGLRRLLRENTPTSQARSRPRSPGVPGIPRERFSLYPREAPRGSVSGSATDYWRKLTLWPVVSRSRVSASIFGFGFWRHKSTSQMQKGKYGHSVSFFGCFRSEASEAGRPQASGRSLDRLRTERIATFWGPSTNRAPK